MTVHAPLEPRTKTNKLNVKSATENAKTVLISAKLAFPETIDLVQPSLPSASSSAEPSLPPVSAESPGEFSQSAKYCCLPVHSEQKNLRKTVSSEVFQLVKLCFRDLGGPTPSLSSLRLQPPLPQLAAHHYCFQRGL